MDKYEINDMLDNLAKASGNPKAYIENEFNTLRGQFGMILDEEAIIKILGKKLLGITPTKIEKEILNPEKIVKTNPFNDIDLEDKSYPPFGKIENGITYNIELISSEEEEKIKWCRTHTGGNYPGTQYLWTIKVLAAKPKPSKEKVIKKEKEVFKFMQIGEEYTLALRKKAMQELEKLWLINDFGNSPPEITFKRTGMGYQSKTIFNVA